MQFTTHFIDFFVVETKRFVGSSLNVILTWQTCGQRSSRAAKSKRRALGNYFPGRICYIFLMSICRGDWDLGLCTFWVLGKREPLRNAKFRLFLRAKHVFSRKIGFLQYLQISGEIWYPNGPIAYWNFEEGNNQERSLYCACWVLLSTIMRGGEQADQKNARHKKIALAHEHNWALIRQLLHAESPVPARVVSAIRPGLFFCYIS